MKKILFFLVLFGIGGFFLFSKQSYALILCDGYTCGGGSIIQTTCISGVPDECTSGQAGQYCGKGDYCPYTYCGWNSNLCCSQASAWTKYKIECATWSGCYTDPVTGKQVCGTSCQDVAQVTGQVCSIGDKCVNSKDTTLAAGQCDCTWGPTYKTCCDSNGNQNTCIQSNADNIYPDEGDCPNITVRCGSSGYPSCGQPACDTLAPPMTVSGTITDVSTGTGLSGISVLIRDNKRSTSTTVTTDSSGNYTNNNTVHLNDSFTITPNHTATSAPCSNGYICGNSWSPTSSNPYTAGGNGGGSGCTINNTAHTIDCDFNYTKGSISGHVYLDYNHNGSVDSPQDTGYSGLTVSTTGASATTLPDGSYQLTPLSQGSHTVTLTVPAGYTIVGSSSQTVTIGPNNTTTDFYITPLYSISGLVYNDIDKNTYHGAFDTPYTGSGSVTISGPTNVTASLSSGAYSSGTSLLSGTYTISYSPPTDYQMTYPVPPNMTVTIGMQSGATSQCNTNGVHDAVCSAGGNISNADFGITNEFVWFQGYCSDLRNDNGFTDTIPSTAACGCADGAVATCQSATTCTNAGIVFSGNTAYNFGSGQPNLNDWIAGGGTTPESFTPVNSTIIRSSYEYLSAVADENGITPTNITTVAGCSVLNSCSPTNITSGVYKASGSLTLTGLTIPAATHVVLLVNGDLTIKGTIITPVGSTLTISSSRDILVDPAVGESSVNSTTADLQGFFSADRTFQIQSAYLPGNQCNSNGTPKDLKLNIAGSVIVNAYHLGGTFENDRDMCQSDLTCPTNTLTFRPDFILNAPTFIKHKTTAWEELAP